MNSKTIVERIDINSTLEQLENDSWGKAPGGATTLITKCYELRRKKVRDFETEDFRLLIGQNIGLQFLVPLALGILHENAFAEGDLYEGDLLRNVLKSESKFWTDHADLKREVVEIFERNRMELQALDVPQKIKDGLLEAYHNFTTN